MEFGFIKYIKEYFVFFFFGIIVEVGVFDINLLNGYKEIKKDFNVILQFFVMGIEELDIKWYKDGK